jgi:hypothetical protein
MLFSFYLQKAQAGRLETTWQPAQLQINQNMIIVGMYFVEECELLLQNILLSESFFHPKFYNKE